MATKTKATARAPKATARAPKATAPANVTELLTKARGLLVQEDDVRGSLAALLSAWHAKPSQAIAKAVDALGAYAIEHLQEIGPTGRTPKERNQAWDEAAKAGDPVVLGILAATLSDTKGANDTLARIELLVSYRDPRVSAKVADFVERPIYNASVSRTTKFWQRIFELLPELGDPRILLRSRTWTETWRASAELNEPERERLPRRLNAIKDALEAAYGSATLELSDSETSACAELVAVVTRSQGKSDKKSEADLLQAIYDDPNDDDVRLVYADHLLERGDVRGELITLQIQRARLEAALEKVPRASRERENELLAKHMMRWLGPLAPKVKKTMVRFERGFMAACSPKVLELDADPAWSTVVELEGAYPSSETRLPVLRAMRNVGREAIEALLNHPRPLPLEELEIAQGAMDLGDTEAASMFARIPRSTIPNLRRFALRSWLDPAVTVDALTWMWESPIAASLERLLFPSSLRGLGDLHARLLATKLPFERVVIFGGLDLVGGDSGWGWAVVLENDEHAPNARLSRFTVVAPDSYPWFDRARFGNDAALGVESLGPTAMTSLRVLMPKGTVAAKFHDPVEQRLSRAIRHQTRLADKTVTIEVGSLRSGHELD